MSSESRASSRTSSRKREPRRLDEALLRRAQKFVLGYRIVIEPSGDGDFIGYSLELPGILGHGTSPHACAESTVKTQTFEVATLLEQGMAPPTPVAPKRRDVQLNLRITAEEKLAFESAANEHGFRNMSEFVRTAAKNAAMTAQPRSPRAQIVRKRRAG